LKGTVVAAAKKKSVEVVFDKCTPQKKVVRFDCTDSEPAVNAVWLRNAEHKELGEPKILKGTFEAGE
jgi:hypothetical protein